MRTLIITNSYDVTVDLIINKIGHERFIRINYDRPHDWKIQLETDNLRIESNLGKFTLEHIAKGIWRKPFGSEPEASPYNDKFYKEEWKYLLYELTSLLRDKNRLRFNYPTPDYAFSKITQNRIAKRHFKTSLSICSINIVPRTNGRWVAKSLSGIPFQDGSVLYTTDVSEHELDSNIWFLQKAVTAEYDLTAVYLYGEIFLYRLPRKLLSSLDWRKEQFSVVKDWEKVRCPVSLESAISSFMNEAGLCYGRLDFLQDSIDADPIFLEVNRNGQWAWLDHAQRDGLFNAMCNVYDPAK